MAAPQPTVAVVQPAPALPSLPKTEPSLVDYLQSLALWATKGLQNRVRVDQAQPFIMLMQSDATPGTTPKVYKITVDNAGALHTAVMILGHGP